MNKKQKGEFIKWNGARLRNSKFDAARRQHQAISHPLLRGKILYDVIADLMTFHLIRRGINTQAICCDMQESNTHGINDFCCA